MTNKLSASPSAYGNYLELNRDYDFYLLENVITIPKGFTWDGATIPKIFWRLIGTPFDPKFLTASLIHDYLIYKGYDGDIRDTRFKQELLVCGVPYWKASIMKHAVVLWRVVKSKLS
jgi:hypothetical protein